MSNVYGRNKKKTVFSPVDTAAQLQDEITKYVMNEKRVPKKWRFVIGLDLIKKVDELNDNVIDANEYWMQDNLTDPRRIELWRKALANCKQIDRKLVRAERNIPSVTASSMTQIAKLLSDEEYALTDRLKKEKPITG